MSWEDIVGSKVPGYQSPEKQSLNHVKDGKHHVLGADRLLRCHALCIKAAIHIDDRIEKTVRTMKKRGREADCKKFEEDKFCVQKPESGDGKSFNALNITSPLHQKETLYISSHSILISKVQAKSGCAYIEAEEGPCYCEQLKEDALEWFPKTTHYLCMKKAIT